MNRSSEKEKKKLVIFIHYSCFRSELHSSKSIRYSKKDLYFHGALEPKVQYLISSAAA